MDRPMMARPWELEAAAALTSPAWDAIWAATMAAATSLGTEPGLIVNGMRCGDGIRSFRSVAFTNVMSNGSGRYVSYIGSLAICISRYVRLQLVMLVGVKTLVLRRPMPYRLVEKSAAMTTEAMDMLQSHWSQSIVNHSLVVSPRWMARAVRLPMMPCVSSPVGQSDGVTVGDGRKVMDGVAVGVTVGGGVIVRDTEVDGEADSDVLGGSESVHVGLGVAGTVFENVGCAEGVGRNV